MIFHDHGSRYLGKMFNDDWMREKGFLEKSGMTARDLVALGLSGELLVDRGQRAGRARGPADERARLLADLDHARQPPRRLAQRRRTSTRSWCAIPRSRAQPVESIMQPAFPFVDISTPVELLSTMITPAESGGAGARFQDRQDLHHHAVGRDPRALLRVNSQLRRGSENRDLTLQRAYNPPL